MNDILVSYWAARERATRLYYVISLQDIRGTRDPLLAATLEDMRADSFADDILDGPFETHAAAAAVLDGLDPRWRDRMTPALKAAGQGGEPLAEVEARPYDPLIDGPRVYRWYVCRYPDGLHGIIGLQPDEPKSDAEVVMRGSKVVYGPCSEDEARDYVRDVVGDDAWGNG